MKKIYTLAQLRDFGRNIGQNVTGGETIELIGDVGAGKTTLTKEIARGLGIEETLQSPTFTISNRYDSPNNLTLTHYDFYRLNEAGIMSDELDETTRDEETVTVIEWASIVDDVLPKDRLQVRLAPVSETERTIEITSTGEKSNRLLEKLG